MHVKTCIFVTLYTTEDILKLEGTSLNPCRIAVNPNTNVDLSTQKHITYRISHGHSLYQV